PVDPRLGGRIVIALGRTYVEHAEPALRRKDRCAEGPVAQNRIQTVGGIVTKVQMVMTLCELELAVSIGRIAVAVGIEMGARITDVHVGSANVRCRDRKPQYPVIPRSYFAFDDRTRAGRDRLIVHDPGGAELVSVYDHVRLAG